MPGPRAGGQRLELCRRQRARIGAVAQKDQRGELVEEAGRLDGGRDQDEAGVQQGEPSVHHLEQLIEEHRQGDIGRGHHQVGRQPGPVEQLVVLDVMGRGREVALDDQHGGHDGDGVGAAEDVDQVQGPGHPCQPTRRTTHKGIHQDLRNLCR